MTTDEQQQFAEPPAVLGAGLAASEPQTPAYVWFDAEFTSLDVDQSHLLQVAMIVTDVNLRRMLPPARDIRLCLRLDASVPVSDWVEKNLAELLARCRSDEAVTVGQADEQLAAALDDAVGPRAEEIKRRPVLAGNSVYMDMALVRRWLPSFADRLHYGLLDVSSLKVLWTDWFRGGRFDKEQSTLVRRYLPIDGDRLAGAEHDAYYDVHASMAELNFYRQMFGWSSRDRA